jgi:hypothetical protein
MDEESRLDETARFEEGKEGIVGPTGGELSLDGVVGPVDVKLPG